MNKVQANPDSMDSFQVWKELLCFFPRRVKRRRWVVPTSLRPVLLSYFHDSVLAGNLGARKTFQKIAANFWWPRMRSEIFVYVHRCDLCQRAKPTQDARVGLHDANPFSQPMERLFVDFVGPLTRTKRGNLAILVVVDGFSKFVSFSPVQKMSAQAVLDCLERSFFPAYGTPTCVVTDNAKVFRCRQFKDLCFPWGIAHVTTTPYYPQAR